MKKQKYSLSESSENSWKDGEPGDFSCCVTSDDRVDVPTTFTTTLLYPPHVAEATSLLPQEWHSSACYSSAKVALRSSWISFDLLWEANGREKCERGMNGSESISTWRGTRARRVATGLPRTRRGSLNIHTCNALMSCIKCERSHVERCEPHRAR